MPKTLTIKEAAKLLNVGVQAVRIMIQQNRIPGACWYGSDNHRTYYITDAQIDSFMKGRMYDRSN